MKIKFFFKKVLVLMLILTNCIGVINVYAENLLRFEPEQNISNTVEPRFIALAICWNNLELKDGGKLTCGASTELNPKYKNAGVKMELQQYKSDKWGTIKIWEATGEDFAVVIKDYYVMSGYDYRLKLTYYAMDDYLNVVETFTNYSKTVSY